MPLFQAVLALVFFTSGSVSLIFQVVWQRLLTLSYGVGPVSVTLIVSVYMFGLGFGSLLGGYLAERMRRRIDLYLLLEASLGVFGLLSLPYLDILGRATAGCSHAVAFVCLFLFLCVPTLAMGMTLPLLVKIFNRQTHDFFGTVAFLYFINTLGAAFGALLASYVLISLLGLDRTVYVAAGVDFVLAWLIAVIGLARRPEPAADMGSPAAAPALAGVGGLGRAAYALVLVTGFVAIGYEIICFRVMQVLVKDSPYAFSSILAVYLTGIALGSFAMSRYLRRRPTADKKALFFRLQFLLGTCILLTFIGYYHLTRDTHFGALTRLSFESELHPAPWYPEDYSRLLKRFLSLDIFLWPAVFALVPAALMGAGFPLISTLAMTRQNEEGRTVGRVFFWNTVGNVLGGILTGFVLLPWLGTEIALFVMAAVSVCLIVLRGPGRRPVVIAARAAGCAALLVAAFVCFPGRGELYVAMHPRPEGWESYFEEGVDGVIMTQQNGVVVDNYINGQAHGGRPGICFYREAVEALNYAPRAENVLVIGFGTGSIVEAVLKLPEVRRVTLVEINRTLLTNLSKMEVFRNTLTDPRLAVVIDDGRRLLLQRPDRYDLILIDPLRTSTAYSNNLYSQEFFALAGQRLTPGGIFLAWTDEFSVLPRTLASAFRHVRLYNYFCLASDGAFQLHPERQPVILAGFSPNDRDEIEGFGAKFVGDERYLAENGSPAAINHDWRPNCEYFLGALWRPTVERWLGMPWERKPLMRRLMWGGSAALGLLGVLALVRWRRRPSPDAGLAQHSLSPNGEQSLRRAG
jgi:spermidine synthase